MSPAFLLNQSIHNFAIIICTDKKKDVMMEINEIRSDADVYLIEMIE